MAPPRGLRQLADGGQPHADEVRVPSTLHGPGDDLDQAQGLAADGPRQGFAAATRLRTNQRSRCALSHYFLLVVIAKKKNNNPSMRCDWKQEENGQEVKQAALVG
jgi:hypothetical protein